MCFLDWWDDEEGAFRDGLRHLMREPFEAGVKSQQTEIKRLRDIVEKLPKDRQSQPFIPERDTVYVLNKLTGHLDESFAGLCDAHGWTVLCDNSMPKSLSTYDAAECCLDKAIAALWPVLSHEDKINHTTKAAEGGD